ncbi:MAG TPA: N-acetylmuramoyl-L-alanine amidase [Pseudonocardia sp.]|uniref:N-acetylmuramoyl-L-alanine amidase n=1 Tax=Pseudonocardia sp. TaxID=60912 RepID=UPI002CB163C5|nr:N-acetylmuramoyl-L-alanine amidase [Pseudonocardia sp.]HTF54635.1 N-acetylmuramoyl-L-alanine amidase [Pseudonocardia sp.]
MLEGVVGHHTADGPTGEYPSLKVVRDGRADLAGPLCNLGLGRSGTVYVIAAGQAWHAGASAWSGFTDLNDEFLGIEAESCGTKDDWTPAQRDAYPRLVASCLYYMSRSAGRFCGHKECALPTGRKIDPAFWDLIAFRTQVGYLLADPLTRIPKGGEELPSIDDVRAVVREELAIIARRDDIGWARSQVLAALGIAKPSAAPPSPPSGTKPVQQQLDEIHDMLSGIVAQMSK